jgi:hypothetical protein
VESQKGALERMEPSLFAYGNWERVLHTGNHLIQMVRHEPTDLPMTETFGRWINRQNNATTHLVSEALIVRLGEYDLLARVHLPAVEVLDRPGHEYQLALLYHTIEIDLSRPGTLNHTGRISDDSSEYSQPAASWHDRFGDYSTH